IKAQLSAQKTGASAQPIDMPAPGILDRRADSEAIDQKVAESMVADLPVLRMAYLIERDFAEFYTMASEKSGGDAHKVLEMLAHWESGHERLFKHLHDKAFEAYSGMPWGG
ncbi:MAG: rubrerythrin, partial [Chloroflexota bacterium]